MRHVNKSTGKVTGIGCLHSSIGKTLTSTVRGDEVLKHRHSFLEVRKNRVLNNLRAFCSGFLRLGHKTTHTGKLLNLVFRTTGTGIEHHEYGVKALIGLCHLLQEDISEVIIYVSPCINNLIVALGIGDESHIIVVGNITDFLVTTLNDTLFLWRNDDIVKVE